MRIGLVFLPDEPTTQACERLSAALVRDRRPRVTLGPGRLAHVSLLHVEVPSVDGGIDADGAWAECAAALPAEVELSFMGLALLDYSTPYNVAPGAAPAAAATMAYLMVPCTEALRRAERAAAALGWVRAARITTGNGDAFAPHVTAAIWDGPRWPATEDLAAEPIARGRFGARLALGVIGENGVYERTLAGG